MIGAIIERIVGWFFGGGIAAIGQQLNEAYAARLKAQTDHEKLESDQRIALLQAQQAVLIAEQGSWLTSWVRPGFALPFVIYNGKLVLWDKVLHWGVTDPLSAELLSLEKTVVQFYFMAMAVEKVSKVIAAPRSIRK